MININDKNAYTQIIEKYRSELNRGDGDSLEKEAQKVKFI
jgi:hypothetical protein